MLDLDTQRRSIFMLKMLGVAALYVLLIHIDHRYFESGTTVSPFEAASGFALAVLLIGGKRYAWGVFLGALLINATTAPFWKAVIISSGHTLEVLCGAWLLTRDNKFDLAIRSLRDYLRLLLLGGIVGIGIGANFGAASLLLFGFITPEYFSHELVHWWTGDILGVILIAPLTLVCWQTKNDWHGTKRLAEAALLLGLTFVAGQIVFLGWFHTLNGLFQLIAKGYWMFLFIALVAARLGPRGTVIALNMTAVQALLGAYQGVGFFANDIAQTQLANYWFYSVILSVVGMALATYFSGIKLNEKALRDSESRFRNLVETTSDWIWEVDENAVYTYASPKILSILGYETAEIIGKRPFDLMPPNEAKRVADIFGQIVAKRESFVNLENVNLHKDGHLVILETSGVPVVGPDGKFCGYRGIDRNITERKRAENMLNQFKYTLDQTLDSIFMFDASNFHFIYVNEGAMKQVGYAYDELLGMTPLDIKPEFTPERFQKMVQPLRDGTIPSLSFETVHRHKNGHDIPVEIFLQLVRKAGAAPRYMAIVRDISERKQAEDTLRKLSLAVEQSPSSVVITDLNANIEYVNQAFIKETGYSFAEAIGQNPRLLDSGKNPKATYREMWACLARGEVWKGELINRRKDGSEYIESALISPIHQPDGRKTHYLAIKENITERKQNEAKIIRLGQIYRLLSQVNEAIVHAQDGKELFATLCNAAVESGLFRLAWVGMLDGQKLAVTPVVYAGVEEGYTDKLNIRLDDERTGYGPTGRAIRGGTYVVCQDIENDPSMVPWRDEVKRRGYRSSGVFPIYEAASVSGAINVYAVDAHFFTQDIIRLMLELAADVSFALDAFAERKRRELAEDEIRQLNVELEHRVVERTRQLEAANKELEAFSYSVSHDLRAPLRSIDGFSRVLSKNYYAQLDATGKDWLERVCRASQRMGHLIDDMLQLSKVARSPLKRESVDLSEIAENVASDLRKTHLERQVRFTWQQDLMVHADTGLMRIVMDNLLGNAWKYTSKKTEAEIEFGMHDINGKPVFFVRDNGAGFNMDYADKLFGAFQRLHGDNEFEGTGIGLATVQRIIQRHNGEVWADALEGQGAIFYFTLPQKTQETEEAR